MLWRIKPRTACMLSARSPCRPYAIAYGSSHRPPVQDHPADARSVARYLGDRSWSQDRKRRRIWRSSERRAGSARSGGSYWSWPKACPSESGGLVNEHQAPRVKSALMCLPPDPATGDVGAILFAGVQCFLNVIPSCLKKRHTAP